MIGIRKGTMQDVEPFIELMAHVRRNMEHKEWLYLDSPDEVRERMQNGTMSLWVAVDGERIVGAFDALNPKLEPFNYGYCIGLCDEELLRVANMDTAVVHPDYRGLGLQKRLMQCAETELAEAGKRILMCTVHPQNQYSLNNVLSQGYTICKTVAMYGSERHVLRKNIGQSIFSY